MLSFEMVQAFFTGLLPGRPRLLSGLVVGLLFMLGLLWVSVPAVALASHVTGTEECYQYDDWEHYCECMHHVSDLIKQQLVIASPDPAAPYSSRKALKKDDNRRVAWWRVENEEEACARLDLMASARGITRLLAGSVTGLMGMSFVWCVVQMMQESVNGGSGG